MGVGLLDDLRRDERRVLATILAETREGRLLLDALTPGDFGVTPHRALFSRLKEAHGRGAVVRVAGYEGEQPIGAGEFDQYVTRLREGGVKRNLQRLLDRAAGEFEQAAANGGVGIDWMRAFAAEVNRTVTMPVSGTLQVGPDELLAFGLAEVERRCAATAAPFVNLGLEGLSAAVMAEPGQLLILAGGEKRGKTVLVLNIAWALAYDQGRPVLYVNTEMAEQDVAFRLLGLASGLPVVSMRSGTLTEADLTELRRRVDEVRSRLRLTVTQPLAWATASDISAQVRYAHLVHGIDIAIVDYIQRLEPSRRGEEDWQTLLNAAKALKNLALELNILIICVAQLNAANELARSLGMARECDAVVRIDAMDGAGPATHQLRVVKSRHTRSNVTVDLVMDPLTLEFHELIAGAGGKGSAQEAARDPETTARRRSGSRTRRGS